MRHYFVTGGTGVVGSALVPVLLESPDNEVWLLVRAADEAALARRIDDLFRFWQFGDLEPAMRQRVHALRGDATEPHFGLRSDEYGVLLSTITHIVHAAGAVRMNLPLEEARRSAVGSARQVVDLAWALHGAGRLHKVEFVSTVGVGGRLQRVPEDWIDTPREFHNTYEQAKAEAEDLARREVERGLPLTVHRPSMVVGDSRSGRIVHFQVFYHLCEFLSGRRTLGLFPPLGPARIDLVASDQVARVLAWSSTNERADRPILHVASGFDDALPVGELRDLVRERLRARGERLPNVVTLPQGLFRAAVAAAPLLAGRHGRALRTLPLFLDYLGSAQQFAVERTRSVLAHGGFARAGWPSQSSLATIIDWYLDSRARS